MKGFKIRNIDKGWEALMSAVRAQAADNISVKVGVIGGSRTGDDLTNAEIAMVHEYGSPAAGIPERSFLRASIDLNREKYRAYMHRTVGKLLDKWVLSRKSGPVDLTLAFERLGLMAAADVKRLMRLSGYFVPLKPETMRRKGSSKPLIDTGQLINSITYEITHGKKRGP